MVIFHIYSSKQIEMLMLNTFIKAMVTIVNDIVTEIMINPAEAVLPLTFQRPTSLHASPLEEVVVMGTDIYGFPIRRRYSFFEDTNGARAPHSPE